MTSKPRAGPSEAQREFKICAPTAEALGSFLTENVEKLVLVKPENLADICGFYVGIVQSMLTVYLKRDSFKEVTKQIGDMVTKAV